LTLKLNITNEMANFISQSLKCSKLTPDSFLNNPVFFNSCWTFRCNSFRLAGMQV